MATKNRTNGEGASTVINIIGTGTEITGDVVAKGDIRVDGKISGNLITESKLIVGQAGFIDGEIKAKIADISGKIKGKLSANELVILRATSDFSGELYTDKLIIEEGAVFNGTCSMKSSTVSQPQGKK